MFGIYAHFFYLLKDNCRKYQRLIWSSNKIFIRMEMQLLNAHMNYWFKIVDVEKSHACHMTPPLFNNHRTGQILDLLLWTFLLMDNLFSYAWVNTFYVTAKNIAQQVSLCEWKNLHLLLEKQDAKVVEVCLFIAVMIHCAVSEKHSSLEVFSAHTLFCNCWHCFYIV